MESRPVSAFTTPALVSKQLIKADTGESEAVTDEFNDYFALVADYCFSMSKIIEMEVGQTFVPYFAEKTIYFTEAIGRDRFKFVRGLYYVLELEEDLLAVTEIVYMGQTLASSQYRLVDINDSASGYPYRAILFDTDDLPDFGIDFTDAVVITGEWGSQDSPSDAYSSVATLSADVDDEITTLTVADATLFEIGQYLRLEDELVRITATTTTPTPDELTVLRGVNGSTAAAHLTDTTIQRWQVTSDVELLATRMVAYWYGKRNDKGERIQVVGSSIVIAEFSSELRQIAGRRKRSKFGAA